MQICVWSSSSAFLLYPVDTYCTFSSSSASPVMVPKQIPFLHLVMCWSMRRDSHPSLGLPLAPPFSAGFLSQDGDKNTNITRLLVN